MACRSNDAGASGMAIGTVRRRWILGRRASLGLLGDGDVDGDGNGYGARGLARVR